MYLFYAPDIEGDYYTLNAEESRHCIRVLRFTEGESVSLVDGKGNWYNAVVERPELKGCGVRVTEKIENHGQRPFHLHLAVAPTKNIDRTEWMLEKCTEMGIDEITLLHTAHSERKVVKDERLEKVLVSAMKQSLKAYLPRLNPMVDFRQMVTEECSAQKFIAHCCPGEKKRLDEVYQPGRDAVILIGPEGDFSTEEVALAEANGFIAISLGTSRLRTETAGIVACHSINFMNKV
ncbi:16S rRNA (uracil(1498)-N(3))-methyltransferase [Odoribacter sp. Z80]|uniref:16S rRNA (uracil(1498)-N(3))-methyltransferase n=1 Tax=Odoribacter sp. Z80 TaxID=2304575 RepID=UPI00137B384B|nr:16S rRNA (uracil(1498)-N(3))-methyltransferase [Odoribacter sp. Z80]NCE72025.1 16S rRNA (uracil(1498)-N(3))-methyltransferase [Odoribacter sp. Z80]